MREFEAEFKKKGAHLAVVGLGDASYARFFREKTGIQFPLLIDDKREAYKTVGLRHASLLHLLRKDNFQARKGQRQQDISNIASEKIPYSSEAALYLRLGTKTCSST